MTPVIALTYSKYDKNLGGVISQRLVKAFMNAGMAYNAIDCRLIVEPNPKLVKLFRDNDTEFLAIISNAKEQAYNMLLGNDALAIPGNDDNINPVLYGKDAVESDDDGFGIARSLAEMALIHVANLQGKPIFGFCGGYQLYNVYMGSTLHDLSAQDLLEQGECERSMINFTDDSVYRKIFGCKSKDCESREFFGFHGQAIETPGGIKLANGAMSHKITAHATDAGKNPEASESLYGAPAWALQFHPEVDFDTELELYEYKGQPKFIGTNDKAALLGSEKFFKAIAMCARAYEAKTLALCNIGDKSTPFAIAVWVDPYESTVAKLDELSKTSLVSKAEDLVSTKLSDSSAELSTNGNGLPFPMSLFNSVSGL